MLDRSSIVNYKKRHIKPLRIGPNYDYYLRPKRKAPLTVCIAAICENNTIFGASDRMITAGDVEFEPALDSLPKPEGDPVKLLAYKTNTKIFSLSSSIVAMTAGDSGVQAEVIQDVYVVISKRIAEQPDNWWEVKDVVDAYVHSYNKIKVKHLMSYALQPYGLDIKAFLEGNNLPAEVMQDILERKARFDENYSSSDGRGVQTIVTGIDRSGPHIYELWNASPTCCDSVGFSAIGSGARHAESQFMIAGHSRYSPMPETVLLTYLAKKRSEIAPGVGRGTDMFTLGPTMGQFAMLDRIPDLDMKVIDGIYHFTEGGQAGVFNEAKEKTRNYIDEIFKKRDAAKAKPDQKPNADSSLPT